MADTVKVNIDGVGTIELDAGFLNLSEEERQATLQEIVSQVGGNKEEYSAPRGRMAAQGALMGFSDEIIAAAKNPMSAASYMFGGEGEDYTKDLERERALLEEYRKKSPIEAALVEAGGGIVPGLLAAPFTGGASAAATGGNLLRTGARLAATGALQGAAYGFGAGEGSLAERAKSALGGGAAGAVAGPIGGAVAKGLSSGAGVISSAARSMFGNKAGRAVEAEIQRMAAATGKTQDEIVEGIAKGEILAENETLRMTVRKLMSMGGTPETTVRKVFGERPQRLRNQAMEALRGELAPEGVPNVKANQRALESAARVAEREAYQSIPGAADMAPAEVVDTVAQAINQFPSIRRELVEYVGGSTRSKPFFDLGDADKITIGRIPTLQEAEVVRRFLNKKANEAYRSGSPMGEVYKDFERALRDALDTASPTLSSTRAGAATVRKASEAFDYGVKALSKDPDEFEMMVADLADQPEALKALKSGVMAALRRKASSAGGTSMMANLADENRDYGRILRTLFPEGELDDVMLRIENAAQSQAARGDIIKGPSTALTQEAGKRIGAGLNAGEVADALQLNPRAIMSVGMKMAQSLKPDLTEAQRQKIVDILVSEDPTVVLNALNDQSGAAALGRRIEQIAAALGVAAKSAGTTMAASGGSASSRGLLGEQ